MDSPQLVIGLGQYLKRSKGIYLSLHFFQLKEGGSSFLTY